MRNLQQGRMILAGGIALLLLTGVFGCAGSSWFDAKSKVIAIDDHMIQEKHFETAIALGAMQALKEAGMGDVIVTGFDARNEVIDSIKTGEIKATVLQPITRIAEMAVLQADTYLRTGSTGKPEKQAVNCELITAANADRYWNFGPVKQVSGSNIR